MSSLGPKPPRLPLELSQTYDRVPAPERADRSRRLTSHHTGDRVYQSYSDGNKLSSLGPKPPRLPVDLWQTYDRVPAPERADRGWRLTSHRTLQLIVITVALFAITLLAGLKFNPAILFPSIIFALPVSLLLPGYMLIRLLDISCRRLSEWILYSIGVSIFLLFATGLLINTLLPMVGIARPLDTLPVILLVILVNLLLAAACYLRSVDLTLELRTPHPSALAIAAFALPPLFVVGAVMGAVGLNNHAGNLPVMIVLGGIGAYALLLLLLRKRVPDSLFPYSLFFLTLALLLGTSLRGWVISGHDILYEFAVFEMTKSFGVWSMSHYQDAYNACLSITLLPTMLSAVLPKIPDQLILRGLFQIIFALTPVALFVFLKKYVSNAIAFLACLFFVSQPPLLQDFAFLTRQEIAMLFYMLALLAFSSKSLSRPQQYLLALFFGAAMVWSHYSTTYIAIAVLVSVLVFRNRIMAKFVNLIKIPVAAVTAAIVSRPPVDRDTVVATAPFRQLSGRSSTVASGARWLPGWSYVVLLILMTASWNVWITGTQNNFTTFVASVYRNVSEGGFSEYKAGLTDQLNIYNNSRIQSSAIDTFVSSHTGGDNTADSPRYSSIDYQGYNPSAKSDIMFNPNDNVAQTLYSNGEIYKKFAKIFIIAGIMWLVLSGIGSFIVDDDFKLFMSMNILVLGLAMVMPLFSKDYSLLRAYQQLLIGLGLPAVVGAYAIFRLLLRKYVFIGLGLFFVVYFLLLSSFLPELLGFGYAQLNLNNFGLYYEIHYSHRSEQEAISWLTRNSDPNYPVFADFDAKKKIDLFGNRPVWVVPNVLPQNINRNAYVFADYTNLRDGLSYSPFGGDVFAYSFPNDFLNQHKDIIYSNGQTEIFK